jgi:hypothetical protein
MPCDCHGKDNVEIQRHVLVLLLAINATMFCLVIRVGEGRVGDWQMRRGLGSIVTAGFALPHSV